MYSVLDEQIVSALIRSKISCQVSRSQSNGKNVYQHNRKKSGQINKKALNQQGSQLNPADARVNKPGKEQQPNRRTSTKLASNIVILNIKANGEQVPSELSVEAIENKKTAHPSTNSRKDRLKQSSPSLNKKKGNLCNVEKLPIFSNSHILNQVKQHHFQIPPEEVRGKQIQQKQSQQPNLLKRHKSVDLGSRGNSFSQNLTLKQQFRKFSSVEIQRQKGKIPSNRGTVPIVQFQPSFKQLLKRPASSASLQKTPQSVQMRSSEQNMQRAIQTASNYRKKNFKKLLQMFEESKKMVVIRNPEVDNIANEQHVNEKIHINHKKPSSAAFRNRDKKKVSSVSLEDDAKRQLKIQERQQQELNEECCPWSATQLKESVPQSLTNHTIRLQ